MSKYVLVAGRLSDTASLRLAIDCLSSWSACIPYRELAAPIAGESEEAVGEAIQDLYCQLEDTTWPLTRPGGNRELLRFGDRLKMSTQRIPELQRRIVATGELPDSILRRIFDFRPELAIQPTLKGNSVVFEVDAEKLSEYQKLADDIEFEEAKKPPAEGEGVQWTWQEVDSEMRKLLAADPDGFSKLSPRKIAKAIGCNYSLLRKVVERERKEFWSKVFENTRHERAALPAVSSLTDKVAESIGEHDEELARLIAEQTKEFEESPLVSTESRRGRIANRRR